MNFEKPATSDITAIPNIHNCAPSVRAHKLGSDCYRFVLPPAIREILFGDDDDKNVFVYSISADGSTLRFTAYDHASEEEIGNPKIYFDRKLGRVTIPKAFREIHALHAGDKVALRCDFKNHQLFVTPVRVSFTAMQMLERVQEVAESFYPEDQDKLRRIKRLLIELSSELMSDELTAAENSDEFRNNAKVAS